MTLEKIPQAGRITAIADVFDTLTSSLPCKEPFSAEKSVLIIVSSGSLSFVRSSGVAFY